ncbi:hypothetical protein C8Q76DRAFT_695098 [Earliella scabrosa]|nr:hypothetical protein C8Q76DRAFT_695098 [Earliella scabrosa]
MSTIIAPIPTTPITPINLGYESDSGSSVCGDVFSDMSDLSSSEETDVDSVASVDSEVEDSHVSDDEPSYLSDRRDLANPTVLRRPPMGLFNDSTDSLDYSDVALASIDRELGYETDSDEHTVARRRLRQIRRTHRSLEAAERRREPHWRDELSSDEEEEHEGAENTNADAAHSNAGETDSHAVEDSFTAPSPDVNTNAGVDAAGHSSGEDAPPKPKSYRKDPAEYFVWSDDEYDSDYDSDEYESGFDSADFTYVSEALPLKPAILRAITPEEHDLLLKGLIDASAFLIPAIVNEKGEIVPAPAESTPTAADPAKPTPAPVAAAPAAKVKGPAPIPSPKPAFARGNSLTGKGKPNVKSVTAPEAIAPVSPKPRPPISSHNHSAHPVPTPFALTAGVPSATMVARRRRSE